MDENYINGKDFTVLAFYNPAGTLLCWPMRPPSGDASKKETWNLLSTGALRGAVSAVLFQRPQEDLMRIAADAMGGKLLMATVWEEVDL